jgi:catechol 2,3-dioxygenase-like lactoylglutathione lyase family enzyme
VRLLATLLTVSTVFASDVPRPKILGVAHLAVYVKDLAKSRQFYEDFLGYQEPFKSPAATYIKINDRQYVELFNEPDRGEGQLHHIAIYTDNAARMREYLAAQGVAVPAKVGKNGAGDKSFDVTDPDGHMVEFVEYLRGSLTGRATGKYMPATRVSDRMYHVGILVGDLDKATKFYGGILGFQEFWRGSSTGKTLSWVNMRVPDGGDYVEFMLHGQIPAPENRGSAHHACLLVPNMQKAVDSLDKQRYAREITIRTGTNRKRQSNLFDPDGTRFELMEPDTIDGKN